MSTFCGITATIRGNSKIPNFIARLRIIAGDFRSPLPAKLEYDQSLKSVYVTSKRTENAIFSSNISPNMAKSSVHPSALISASNGTVVDISVDHCNR